jgi:hypothetical protein
MPLTAVHIQAQHGHAKACPQSQMPCEVRKSSSRIVAFTGTSVYREPFSAQQQIRPVALGFFQGGGSAPICYFRVIASNQNLRHPPTSKIRWPRIVRKIQQKGIRDSRVVRANL